MKGDAKVIEYLNRGLRHEMTAINQYWLHYRLLENWGFKALAKYWRKESIEEMEHADKIIDANHFPRRLSRTCRCWIRCISARTSRKCSIAILQAEYSARALYEEAATHCHAVKDYVTRDLFEKLMQDEEEPYRLPRDPDRSGRQARRRALLAASHRQARRRGLIVALPGTASSRPLFRGVGQMRGSQSSTFVNVTATRRIMRGLRHAAHAARLLTTINIHG